MSLTKQGKFKEYYQKVEKIKIEYYNCHNKYFDENNYYNYGYDAFSSFFYEIDEVYQDACDVKVKLKSLLELAEIKTDKSLAKINEYIAQMETIKYNCISDFKNVYDVFNNDLSDMERNTLCNYNIAVELHL